ncbi:uncharacterized protein LOC132722238 [Ruditapes philippinarum]|uniref:uncharacterized protein LOC132722238 n=1 Tax=Ruditapes philippinarum TaxID=129788 RepID=UPI00295ABAE9|nr:uncharacterized protein LOC132722238 [Ruditapes philippinarum]
MMLELQSYTQPETQVNDVLQSSSSWSEADWRASSSATREPWTLLYFKSDNNTVDVYKNKIGSFVFLWPIPVTFALVALLYCSIRLCLKPFKLPRATKPKKKLSIELLDNPYQNAPNLNHQGSDDSEFIFCDISPEDPWSPPYHNDSTVIDQSFYGDKQHIIIILNELNSNH